MYKVEGTSSMSSDFETARIVAKDTARYLQKAIRVTDSEGQLVYIAGHISGRTKISYVNRGLNKYVYTLVK